MPYLLQKLFGDPHKLFFLPMERYGLDWSNLCMPNWFLPGYRNNILSKMPLELCHLYSKYQHDLLNLLPRCYFQR